MHEGFRGISILFLLMCLAVAAGCDLRPDIRTGEEPPGLVCTDLQGDAVILERLKGKVVVLFFWSGICCGDAVRELEPLYGRNRKKGLEIVAINVGETRTAVETYVADNGLTFTVATDEHSMSSWLYSVSGVPTIFILDRRGIVREKILGDVQIGKLGRMIFKYL
ncbi:MAG: hypothetical protein A2X58_12515 [Nitrospirae bacterium GWC2_56_14]|nr:MAG: hypothetical protein A2X58_12515 [Nitrospirae bacterium GWC2_56_14]